MPYKNKEDDRRWHRDTMRARRGKLAHNAVARAQQADEPKLSSIFVTPAVTPLYVDADGNPVYEEG